MSNDPSYLDPAIYYQFVFDVGVALPSALAAAALLETDLGTVSGLAGADAMLFAPRFKELEASLKSMNELADLAAELELHPLKSALRFAIEHPRMFTRSVRQRPAGDGDVAEHSTKDAVAAQRDELRDFLEEQMVRAQFFQAIARHNDRKLFRESYLASDPFARIELQPVTARLGDAHEVGIDVTVLVHRTGVCLLTFYCQFEGAIAHAELVRRSVSGQLAITEATMPFCLHAHRAARLGLREEEIVGERTYQDVEWLHQSQLESSLVEVFELYSDFISDALRSGAPSDLRRDEIGSWFSYPVVILRSGTPPLDQAMSRDEHQPNRHLDELLLRMPEVERFRTPFLLSVEDSDLSQVTDHSFFVQSSHAVVIYHGNWWDQLPREPGEFPAGNDWIPGDLSVISPIEHLLVEKWILEVAQNRLVLADANKKIRQVRHGVGVVLDELSGIPPVQYGSLQDLIERGRIILGVTSQLRLLDEHLRWVEGAIAVSEAEARDQRGRRLSQLSMIVATLLGLPAVWQIVEFLQKWRRVSPRSYWGIGRALNWLTDFARNRPVVFTLVLYTSLLFWVGASVTGVHLRRRKRFKVPRVYTWPGAPLEIIENSQANQSNQ